MSEFYNYPVEPSNLPATHEDVDAVFTFVETLLPYNEPISSTVTVNIRADDLIHCTAQVRQRGFDGFPSADITLTDRRNLGRVEHDYVIAPRSDLSVMEFARTVKTYNPPLGSPALDGLWLNDPMAAKTTETILERLRTLVSRGDDTASRAFGIGESPYQAAVSSNEVEELTLFFGSIQAHIEEFKLGKALPGAPNTTSNFKPPTDLDYKALDDSIRAVIPSKYVGISYNDAYVIQDAVGDGLVAEVRTLIYTKIELDDLRSYITDASLALKSVDNPTHTLMSLRTRVAGDIRYSVDVAAEPPQTTDEPPNAADIERRFANSLLESSLPNATRNEVIETLGIFAARFNK